MARTKSNGSKTESTATIGFEAKLWLTADKLRNNMDAAEPSGARQTVRSTSRPAPSSPPWEWRTPKCELRTAAAALRHSKLDNRNSHE
ncbi:MAG: hypothetical protein ACOYMN_11505 [Roseimicrobium sp.]